MKDSHKSKVMAELNRIGISVKKGKRKPGSEGFSAVVGKKHQEMKQKY